MDLNASRCAMLTTSRGVLGLLVGLTVACGDIDISGMDEPESPVLAQSTSPLLRPTKQQTTSLVTAQRAVPVKITANFGTGCEGVLKPNPEAEKRGLLEVTFETYRIKFAPPGTLIYDTKDCLLRLRVSGVAGHQHLVQSVVFYGMANMFSPQARAIVDARAWWSGKRPIFSNQTTKELEAGHKGNWSHDDSLSAASSASRCFTSNGEVDEITLYTSLLLLNPDPRMPAELAMVSASAGAAVLIDLDTQPCP